MTWLKASNSTWSLAWQRFEDLPGLQSCKWCIFWMSQRIAHPSSYGQLFDRWSILSHTAVSFLLVHCCLVLPHTQDSFRQTIYNGFTATAGVSDRDQSMSASLLDLSYFTMLVFILLIHCVVRTILYRHSCFFPSSCRLGWTIYFSLLFIKGKHHLNADSDPLLTLRLSLWQQGEQKMAKYSYFYWVCSSMM